MKALASLLGAVLALVPVISGSAPVVAPADEPAIDMNAIIVIRCGPSARGTAFWIGRRRLISAEHVTRNGPCTTLDGELLLTVRADAANDIAELRGPDIGRQLPISCGGFREGQPYFATGFAQGLYRHTSRLLATWQQDPGSNGLRVLIGQVHPGMSGGPLVDGRGRVTGIVNRLIVALPFSESRSLSDTFVCRGRRR